MTDPASPYPRRFSETGLTLAAVALLAVGGCSGDGSKPPEPPTPDQVGPVIDAGPQFPIASSRLDVRIFSLREGGSLPPDAVALVQAQSQSTPEPMRVALATRGFLGALMNDDQLVELERLLTTVPVPVAAAAAVVIPPPAPRTPTPEGSGASIIGGPAPEVVKVEPVIGPAPKGPPVSNISSVTIRPGPTWTSLVDAPARTESWALALDQAVVSLKPGTLRWFVRTWPAPAEPVPTAGMAGELLVQFLPVVTGPMHEAAPDPLAPPPLSTDLAARGQVLGRQAITASLRGGAALVLIALPVTESRRAPGPAADAAPMLGQALLGAGPPPTPTGRPTGPRVVVLRPIVPGTYRLLLDRAAAPVEPAR